MTLNTLANQIAKREGSNSKVRIGDILDVLKIISLLYAEGLYKGTVLPIAPIIESGAKILAKMHKRDKKKE